MIPHSAKAIKPSTAAKVMNGLFVSPRSIWELSLATHFWRVNRQIKRVSSKISSFPEKKNFQVISTINYQPKSLKNFLKSTEENIGNCRYLKCVIKRTSKRTAIFFQIFNIFCPFLSLNTITGQQNFLTLGDGLLGRTFDTKNCFDFFIAKFETFLILAFSVFFYMIY